MRVDLSDDPAVIGIARGMQISEAEVVGHLHKLWSWADRHSADGDVPNVTVDWVDRYLEKPGFGAVMRSMGWLAITDDGISFPNFERHNGHSAKVRAQTARRQKASRSRRDKSVTREEKRREDINITPNGVMSGTNRQLKEQAKTVLAFLNQKTGRNYRPVDATLQPIVVRLKEGFTESQCRKVIAKKCREWGTDEKMSPYLRPKTLFNKTNFANYVGELVEVSDE